MYDNSEAKTTKVLIREFNEERDIEVVEKLEKSCEMGSKKGISIITNMMGDPLCRIRPYFVHVMLVAELSENRDLVGVVRGCIKYVGTGFEETYVKIGCILGLRVSTSHRRMGIGLKLVKSIEEWMMRNGAQYTYLATEEENIASTNLFTLKCQYVHFSSLVIFAQPVSFPAAKDLSPRIKIEKLHVDQAISLYKNKLQGKDIYPADIDVILKEKLSLGTWVSYFKGDEWIGLHSKDKIISTTPSSWAMFSIWNTCEAYKLQMRRSHSHPFKFFHAISHAREKIFPCLKIPIYDSLQKPFGFLFLYGLHGEGERLGELMKSVWSFASKLAKKVKDCKVIMTELGVSDPLREHIPQGSSMSCINDLWYRKRVINGPIDDQQDDSMTVRVVGNVFIDPRDF